jgi:RNA polymerase sigma-70 factor, ECF subfamily
MSGFREREPILVSAETETAPRLSSAELARTLRPDLLRFLERYVGDAAEAEDLVQETLARVDRGLAGFVGKSSVKTWVFSIATRVAADYLRKPDRRAKIVEIDETSGVMADDDSAEQRLIADEMSACVREVIESLPEDYRAALILHEMQGLTAEDTAVVCGTSLATAKIRIHRARARLKAALEEECAFYRDAGNVFRCDRKDS